jgi:A/G-specific adenine glycosylase
MAVRVPPSRVPTLRKQLLAWYRLNKRPLPWRRRRTAYAIWVSETMLQQTQAATVIPYYHRFLRQFPTVRALAQAPLTEVLDCWSGLGYYNRAKNLHAGAQKVLKERGGKIPDTAEELRTLPGVGPYTAGAIASIAFDRPVPLVDGNVIRVLCRWLGVRKDPQQADVQRLLWETAGRLVDPSSPVDFNQALMELGATVCTPRAPACPRCPVRALCVARRRGWETRIPFSAPPAVRRTLRYLSAVLEKNGGVLLARRPLTGLLAGLWEFPLRGG